MSELEAFTEYHRAVEPPHRADCFHPLMGQRVIHIPTGKPGFCHGPGFTPDPADKRVGVPLIQFDGNDYREPVSGRYLRAETRDDYLRAVREKLARAEEAQRSGEPDLANRISYLRSRLDK